MNGSPIERLLGALDELDVEATMALLGPDIRLLTADGRGAAGTEGVCTLIADYLQSLRSARHRITAQWHEDDVWIAEIEASYEMKDRLRVGPLPRAIVLRDGPDGIADLRIYGARERPLTDHRSGGEGMLIGARWVPPL